jgi:hypothetical protein
MKMVMSFLRHRRSIVRWVCFTEKGRNAVLLRPLLLTVSMSRNRIFLPPQRRRPVAGDPGLGGLLSSRARLRFTGWSQLLHTSRICKLSGMCPV